MGNEDSPRSHLFIGSSAEGEIVAKAVQYALRGVAEGQVWTQGVFAQTESFLHSLLSEVGKADFAVLVMTPDDLIESRGKTNWVPRDNVIFELGLFLSKLGPERTFVLFQEGRGPLKLPSDLLGITFSPIRHGRHAA
jgi:predicted nucleotide-binding protein